MEAQGRIARQIGEFGYYASVWVICEGGPEQVVSVSPDAEDAFYRREGWLDGAKAGAALGMKLAGFSGTCVITRMHGMIVDTNAALVALAAVRAVWSCVDFEPPDALALVLDQLILRCREVGVAELGDHLLTRGSR